VAETEAHGTQVLFGKAGNQMRHLIPQAAHQFHAYVTGFTGNTQRFLNEATELCICYSQCLLDVLVNNVLLKKLLETLGQLAFNQSGSGFESIVSVFELAERLGTIIRQRLNRWRAATLGKACIAVFELQKCSPST